MLTNFINVQYCYDYLIGQIPVGLLLYSHIPTALIALFFGGFVLYKVRNLLSVTLFVICLSFATWCLFDLASWFSFLGSANTMFTWSLLDMVALLMFLFSYYFVYVSIKGRDLPMWQKGMGLILFFPTAFVTFAGLNLPYYDSNVCEAVENGSITNILFVAQAIVIVLTALLVVRSFAIEKSSEKRKRIAVSGLGILCFLIFFFSSTFLVSLLAESAIATYIYNYEIYGLFGMPVLLGFLAFSVVRYHTFNIKLVGAQALIVALVVLIGSQLLFVEDSVATVLVAITLTLTGLIGINLIRSVKNEVEQREQIEKQEKALEKTNEQLAVVNEHLKELDKQKTEFVSFASHQLRSPLTAIKGYSSLILDGDYGPVGDELKKAAQVIFDSTKTLAAVVDDYLNVSRIELGQMKYNLTNFNIKDLVQQSVDELKPNIEKAGLKLDFKFDQSNEYEIVGDKEKLQQVIVNVIDNSVKYTPKGSVSVSLNKVGKNVQIKVTDTGIGISKDVIPKLFSKFSRATNANKTNIRGTGLGLFIAKEIITTHKGRIWVESEGDGKGSTFYIEVPASK